MGNEMRVSQVISRVRSLYVKLENEAERIQKPREITEDIIGACGEIESSFDDGYEKVTAAIIDA